MLRSLQRDIKLKSFLNTAIRLTSDETQVVKQLFFCRSSRAFTEICHELVWVKGDISLTWSLCLALSDVLGRRLLVLHAQYTEPDPIFCSQPTILQLRQ